MRERDVDRLFVIACKARDIRVYKTNGFMGRGFTDRTIFGPGKRHGFVEVKAHDGVLSHHQQDFLALATRSGAWARVLRGGKDRTSTKRAITRLLDEYMEQR